MAYSTLDVDRRPKPHNITTPIELRKSEKRTLSVLDNLAITCVSSSDPNEAYAVGIEPSSAAESPTILFLSGNDRTVPLLTIQHLEGVCSHLRSIAQLEIDKRPRKEMTAASNRLGLYIFTFCHAKVLYWLQKFMDGSDSGTSEWRARQIPTPEMFENEDPTWLGKWEEVLRSLQTLRSAALSSHEQEPDKYLRMWGAACKVNDILALTPILGKYIKLVNEPLSNFILQSVSHARSARILVSGATSSSFGPLFTRPIRIIPISSESQTIQLDISAIQNELPELFAPYTVPCPPHPPFLSAEVIETEYTNTPHCETTLAMYLLKYESEQLGGNDGKSYCIGCSKSTCLACELFFNRLTLPPAPRTYFLTSNKSRMVYPHYVFPDLGLLEEQRKTDIRSDSVLQLLAERQENGLTLQESYTKRWEGY